MRADRRILVVDDYSETVYLLLKACPRCRGDLIRQYDLDGPYLGCLQCGRVLPPGEEQRLVEALAAVRVNAARAA